ncbi:MAG TPA: hypothetical protein VLX11_14940 [Candidatus Acidoferrales bacterium]|nr:hypothetical protein [Candidatus Acidoferrales bacterium]
MVKRFFLGLTRRGASTVAVLIVAALVAAALPVAHAMDAARGGALPQPLPLFPPDNWWNLDISSWPVDGKSSNYIAFIDNGGSRRLHPDFGGSAGTAQDPNAIYGMPYAVVRNVANSDLKAVEFLYSDESDGVDHATDTSFPFYPIPLQAISQPFWIEGGDPGNVDLRDDQDRHLFIVDGDRNYLYELYNVYYDTSQGRWFAGSGAFFDMNTDNRRPSGWTSADAAGLAILPGLVRYDEVYDPNVPEIRHAFRVTVRATNGFVYPASHRAGDTVGALPMGARLRLKASVDVTQRTSDANIQKIFRAMQRYGLIVADNGSDMYITGTYDTRWNNDILNPAFSKLTASDFEVIQLGYNPESASPSPATLNSVSVTPSSVTGGQSLTGTVSLSGPAPGVSVSLSSASSAVSVPAMVIVPAGATSVNFSASTAAVGATTMSNISATLSGVTKTVNVTVQPATLTSLTLSPATVPGGVTVGGKVALSGPAPVAGIVVMLTSSQSAQAKVPSKLLIPAGARSATFNVATTSVSRKTIATITASLGSITRSAALMLQKR